MAATLVSLDYGRTLVVVALLGAGCLEPDPDYGEGGRGVTDGSTGAGGDPTTSGSDVGDAGSTSEGGSSESTTAPGTTDDGSSSPSTSGTASGSTDTDAPLSPCVAAWHSGNVVVAGPELMTVLNSSDAENQPFLTADARSIYFTSWRSAGAGKSDVYRATRNDPSDGFGTPEPVSDLSSNQSDVSMSMTKDQRVAFLSSHRPGGPGEADLWITTRGDPSDPWPQPTLIAELSTSDNDWDPFPSADGLRLYWYTPSQAPEDLVVAERPSRLDPFGPPTPVGVHSNQKEDNPSLTEDETIIVFGSSRPGGLGDMDLWYATRPDRFASFDPPAPIPGLSSEDRDAETFITLDGCEVWFASDRPGGLGSQDLYRAIVIP